VVLRRHSVGSALGYVLGAGSPTPVWETGVLRSSDQDESWRWAFYLVAPPGILLGLVCFFRRETKRGTTDAAPRAPVPWADYLVLLRTPSYVLCTLGMTAMTFAIGGIAFWMPYYLESRPGAPAASTLIFGAVSRRRRAERHTGRRRGRDRCAAVTEGPIFSCPARRCFWDSPSSWLLSRRRSPGYGS